MVPLLKFELLRRRSSGGQAIRRHSVARCPATSGENLASCVQRFDRDVDINIHHWPRSPRLEP